METENVVATWLLCTCDSGDAGEIDVEDKVDEDLKCKISTVMWYFVPYILKYVFFFLYNKIMKTNKSLCDFVRYNEVILCP